MTRVLAFLRRLAIRLLLVRRPRTPLSVAFAVLSRDPHGPAALVGAVVAVARRLDRRRVADEFSFVASAIARGSRVSDAAVAEVLRESAICARRVALDAAKPGRRPAATREEVDRAWGRFKAALARVEAAKIAREEGDGGEKGSVH